MADASLAIKFPAVAKLWHPTKNGYITPCDVTYGSGKNRWWMCEKNHEWEAKPNTITNNISKYNGNGCPYCSGQKVCLDNCLATKFPEVAKEWHPTKNGDATPYDVTPKSIKKYWWVCPKNKSHDYIAAVANRTSGGNGCSYCASKKICNDNCLATKFPEVAKEWHPTKNGYITPHDVTPGSNKKYWWLCPKNHTYQTACCEKTRNKPSGCPYCTNHKICNDNCLATLYPQIAAQWSYEKNHPVKPCDVFSTTRKKFWWICDKGHIYKASCSDRTAKNSGCQLCNESKGERKIVHCLKNKKYKFERQIKFNSCKHKRRLPFDFSVYGYNKFALIEFHGRQHYNSDFSKFIDSKICGSLEDIKIRDKKKKQWCEDNNIPLLIIPYWEFKNIEKILDEFLTLHVPIFPVGPNFDLLEGERSV